MSVTLVVFQVLTLLLKAEANWNMALMFETLAVSQLLTFWLKEVAPSSV